MANGTLLGGHVHIHDDATLSGSVGVHHFTTIGSFSFVGGLSKVLQEALDAFLAVLDRYTLADLVAPRQALVSLLGLSSGSATGSLV